MRTIGVTLLLLDRLSQHLLRVLDFVLVAGRLKLCLELFASVGDSLSKRGEDGFCLFKGAFLLGGMRLVRFLGFGVRCTLSGGKKYLRSVTGLDETEGPGHCRQFCL